MVSCVRFLLEDTCCVFTKKQGTAAILHSQIQAVSSNFAKHDGIDAGTQFSNHVRRDDLAQPQIAKLLEVVNLIVRKAQWVQTPGLAG